MQEVLRLWTEHKAGGEEPAFVDIDAPPTLRPTDEASTSSDAQVEQLIESLSSLDVPTLHASLAVHGLPVDGCHEECTTRLALALLG